MRHLLHPIRTYRAFRCAMIGIHRYQEAGICKDCGFSLTSWLGS
jgi:hypothetical protein